MCVCAGINSGLAHSKCHVAIYMYACLRLRDHGTEGENQYPWDVPDNKNEMFLTGFIERLIFHKLIYLYM